MVLLALERNDIVSLSRLAALYNLLGYLFLTPFFGIYGIALATCSAAILQNGLLYYFAGKLAGVHVEWTQQATTLTRFILLGLFLACCRSVTDSLFFLAVAATLGSLVVVWSCWVRGVFHAGERQIVLELAQHMVGRRLWTAAKLQPTM
jgi:peptidoglycan biosynthesis protein MviN/MurJ (putative lipid II flippase)